MKNIPATVHDFWRNVRVEKPSDPNSCWIWTGEVHALGYGVYRTIYALNAASIIYTGKLCGRARRPWKDSSLKDFHEQNGACFNRLCVRERHFASVPLEDQTIDPTIKAVLDARGKGSYRVRDIAKKLHISEKIVRRCLSHAPTYDLLWDVQNYINNKLPVPINPDTRKVVVT